jgi:hypothetical protein
VTRARASQVRSDPAGDRAGGPPAGKAPVIAPASHANERLADQAAARVLSFNGGGPVAEAAGFGDHASGTPAPSSVAEELSRAGEPLDMRARKFFEPRFHRDFSNVRIHRDGSAQDSAAAIGARAFTSGDHIVFGRGQWQPHSAAGMNLLAHELAHQAQQPPGMADRSTIWRKAVFDILDFDSGSFSDTTLLLYLQDLRGRGTIEKRLNSDDKARGVVNAWMKGGDAFALEPELKVLLIKEMQSGFTGNDDERAILNLLEKSARPDQEAMFGPGQLDPEDLDSDFHGREEDALRAFYDQLFVGGRQKALGGTAAGFNAQAEQSLGKTYSHADLRAVVDEWSTRLGLLIRDREPALRGSLIDEFAREEAGKLIGQLSPMTPDEKAIAVKDMAAERAKTDAQAIAIDADIEAAATQEKKDELGRRKLLLRGEVLLLDLSLQSGARDVAMAAPSGKADLAKLTTPLDAKTKQAARDAIAPRSMAAIVAEAKGTAPPPAPTFNPKALPGETDTYEDKIKARIPDLIQEHHDSQAKNRTDVEHKDPAKTRSMEDMQKIANQAKVEVDLVFGSFYDKSKFSAFQGDKRDKKGKLKKKGNLRDVWQVEEDRSKVPGYELQSATFWLYYLIQNDGAISAINLAHDASPAFDDETKALNDEAIAIRHVGDPFLTSDTRRLFQIGRGWDAFQQDRDIFIQLFKNPDATADRIFLWDMYFVLMHEYLHKLAAKKYSEYAEKLGGEHSTPGNTLIEGVDSLFSEIAWSSAVKNAGSLPVRTIVEPDAVAAGLPFDINLLPKMPHRRYDNYENAVRLVGVVGLHNLYGAYFRGRIDLIGSP